MSEISISTEDMGRLAMAGARDQAKSCTAYVEEEKLMLSLKAIQTGMPLVHHVDAVFALHTVSLEQNLLRVRIELKHITGGLAMFVRPFLPKILQKFLTDAKLPAVTVEGKDILLVNLAQFHLPNGKRLDELATVQEVRIPGKAGAAMAISFAMRDGIAF